MVANTVASTPQLVGSHPAEPHPSAPHPVEPGAVRSAAIRRGRRLQYFTVAWNSLEGLIALVAGFIASSVALVGFGFDSVIEVTSAAAMLWRLYREGEQSERLALRIVGVCFLALAAYIAYDSLASLLADRAPERSIPGIVLAVLSLIVMPILARAKRRVAANLGSAAMNADARQTDFCTYLSAILLGGLLLNALWGWWWADPLAAIVMIPIIAREGWQALRGKSCCADGCHS
jgi:divalent metal cation (Fe/Co/Zn/Cd) transporter